MLNQVVARGFKSLASVGVTLPNLAVLFGPNTAGKSNFLDAIQALSRIGTSRTLSDALSEPIRGHAIESFAFPENGLPGLLGQEQAEFSLEATLGVGKDRYHYRVGVGIQIASGSLALRDEYLTALDRDGKPKGNPSIEVVEGKLRIRRKSKPAHPRYEPLGGNHSFLSDPRLGGDEYRAIERCRGELSGWRTYYLDPRVSMRQAKSPAAVEDIGVLGENIAPFLYRLRAEKPKHFDAIRRTLSTIIPSIEDFDVDLDTKRGTLDIQIQQGGTRFSSRIISEGTLRVLALCAIVVNPWSGSLVAFEEPENGVHPKRIALIAEILSSLASDRNRQVVVTTHSALFCGSILKIAERKENGIALFNVRRRPEGTVIEPFDLLSKPLFRDQEISAGLASETEDGRFEQLVVRGLVDE